MSISVIVADDHPVFLDGLVLLLETTEGIQVAGRATDGAEFVELAASVPFDVAVVDLDMPGLDGAAATAEVLRSSPDAVVLMLTMHDDADSVARALRAGARGYVLKGSGHGAIVRAILSVAEGDTILSGRAGAHVLTTVRQTHPSAHPSLTAREAELLAHIATGADNATVARQLFLSTKTVQNTVSRLMTKLNASSRAHLVAIAHETGLTGGTSPSE